MEIIKKNWQKIIHLGLNNNDSFSLSWRIVLCNQFALIAGSVCTLLPIFYYFTVRDYQPALLLSLAATMWALLIINYFRFFYLSRVLMSLALPLGILLISLNNTMDGDARVFIARKFIILTSVVIPMCLFSTEETWFFVLFLLLVILLGLGFEKIHLWYGIKLENVGIDSPHYRIVYVLSAVAVVLIFANLIFLLRMNLAYEIRTKQALAEAELRNTELTLQEQKLRNALNELQENYEMNEQQSWISLGLANFSKILPELNNDKLTFNDLLTKIVKFITAHQAALYTRADNIDEILKLRAAYANTLDQMNNKTFKLGEGMVGQCALKGKPLYINDLPENYFPIKSALGQILPQELWIIPLRYNEQNEGVLELAFLEEQGEYKKEFIERLAENIAINLGQARLNRRLRKIAAKNLDENV
jgi:hypothetical protein